MVQRYCLGGFSGRESIFTKKNKLQLESSPTVFHEKGERVFYCNLWVSEKSKTIWFHTNDSRWFLPTPQFIHSQLLHHRYDQNYYISINSATAYFLARSFSCFCSMSKYSCICLLMQTRRKWRHITSWTHLDRAFSPLKCRVLSRALSHCPPATPDLNLLLLFLSWQGRRRVFKSGSADEINECRRHVRGRAREGDPLSLGGFPEKILNF